MLGQKLNGRYQIIQQIGKGGFGTTYLAEDTQRPGNPKCIVKQLKPRIDEENTLREAKRLFIQEAEILEILGEDKQIPRLLAYFQENQEFYLVQEYIEGHDLSKEIPPLGNKFTTDETIEFLVEILEILKFVHQNNVIHRDIKPSNIRRRKSDGKIVLIDFGAVKQIRNLEVNQQGQTTFTIPIGTPGYMPSEQAMGNPNFTSDIYGVGIIAIQALTGIYPMAGGRMPMDENGEISWRHKLEIPSPIAEVIDKMVRYRFTQRYSSASEALEAIREIRPIKLIQPTVKIALTTTEIGNQKITTSPDISQSQRPWVKSLALIAVSLIALVLGRYVWPLIFTSWITYEKSGIKIQYPENWQLQDNPNAITGENVKIIAPELNDSNKNFQDLITIRIDKYSGTLDDYKDNLIKNIKNDFPSAKIDPKIATLANKKAYQIIYEGKRNNNNLKYMKTFALKENQVYEIIYAADKDDYDKFSKSVEKMIKSFELN